MQFFLSKTETPKSQCIHSLIFKKTKSICENTDAEHDSPAEKEHSAQRRSPKLKM